MWWPIIVHRVHVHVLSATIGSSRASGPLIHIVATPTSAHAFDHASIFLRWRTSASPCPSSRRLPSAFTSARNAG